MKNNTVIYIYILFCISIILITVYYTNTNTHTNTNTNTHTNILEKFDASINDTGSGSESGTKTVNNNISIKTLSQQPQTTKPTLNIKELITTINITDELQKNIIITYLQELLRNIEQYSNLSIPININNNGLVCAPWNTYNNSAYIDNANNCINLINTNANNNNENDYQCLTDENILTSCSTLYGSLDSNNNNIIDTNKSINVELILKNTANTIVNNINNITTNITNKKNDLQTLLNNIITKSNFAKQQKNFITYNEYNNIQKKHNINNIEDNIHDTQKDINIKQLNLTNFSSNKTTVNNKLLFYYKCVKYLLIILVIVIILNIISSKLL